MEKLDTKQVVEMLTKLPGWTYDSPRGAICRDFKFGDFQQAFAFMTEVAGHAERLDHHPEWFNVYNRVEVVLTTHDADGVSMRDIRLAELIDAAAARFPGASEEPAE